MLTGTAPKWDQSDYIEACERLNAEIGRLEQSLKAAGKEIPPRPRMVADDLILSFEQLEAHAAKLKTLVSLARPTSVRGDAALATPKLKPTATDRVRSLQEKAARPAEAVSQNERRATMTATERVRAFKAGKYAPEPKARFTGATARILAAKQALKLKNPTSKAV